MKRLSSLLLALTLALGSVLPGLVAVAAPVHGAADRDSGVEITTRDSGQIVMEGRVQPALISVTVPANIPFDISYTAAGENKVLSPKIGITNHSQVPVSVYLKRADVDLRALGGTTWNSTGHYLGINQIAVGFQRAQSAPTSLYGTLWMQEGAQNTHLAYLYPGQEESFYLTGTLGAAVPKNRSFTVTATLVVQTN